MAALAALDTPTNPITLLVEPWPKSKSPKGAKLPCESKSWPILEASHQRPSVAYPLHSLTNYPLVSSDNLANWTITISIGKFIHL